MPLAGPEPLSSNPLRRLVADRRAERRAQVTQWPPGDDNLSLTRTHRLAVAPLALLLDAYARHGPVFSLRILSTRNIFLLGPEATQFVLVTGCHHFRWRDGAFQDLIPLLGDGLLTTDGEFHGRSRRIIQPMFHHSRTADAREVMEQEVRRALEGWRDDDVVDIYRWSRELSLRIAMRALLGLDPDAHGLRMDPAREFERALGFYGHDYLLQLLRGPRTPWARMQASRRRLDKLIYGEIERRRRSGDRGDDILSMLLDAHDEEAQTMLTDRQVRDEVMTLLFAGHDTTTATLSFLLWELIHAPEELERLADEAHAGEGTPYMDRALDETLRLYPPGWIGPRRSVSEFELHGYTVPPGMPVNYCSWASHRLPDVWDEPDAFRPERFSPENRKKIPRGAYVPFGGGPRTCIGMRFGQLEIKVVARAVLRRFTLDACPGYRLRIRQTPTLGPRDGLPLRVRSR